MQTIYDFNVYDGATMKIPERTQTGRAYLEDISYRWSRLLILTLRQICVSAPPIFCGERHSKGPMTGRYDRVRFMGRYNTEHLFRFRLALESFIPGVREYSFGHGNVFPLGLIGPEYSKEYGQSETYQSRPKEIARVSCYL